MKKIFRQAIHIIMSVVLIVTTYLPYIPTIAEEILASEEILTITEQPPEEPETDFSEAEKIETEEPDASEAEELEIEEIDSSETEEIEIEEPDASETEEIEIEEIDSSETEEIEKQETDSSETERIDTEGFLETPITSIEDRAENKNYLKLIRNIPSNNKEGCISLRTNESTTLYLNR